MWTSDKQRLLSGTTEVPTSREYLRTLAAQQDLNWDGNCLPEETEAEETQEPEKKEDLTKGNNK